MFKRALQTVAMESVTSIALGGIQASAYRLEASARRVASNRDTDLASEIVEQKMSEHAYKANLMVLKTADRMIKASLDILV